MVKPLLIIAVLAHLFYSVSTGQAYSHAEAKTNHGWGSSSAVASSTSVSRNPSDCSSPQTPKCRSNEVWTNCPVAVCVPKTCKDVGFAVPCPDLNPNEDCPVPPGCICKANYVRNKVGHCIPMKYCPTCGGDPNAVSGPGTNCNRLCSNYNKKPGACIQGFLYNACECKRGFVFDEIRRICVYPEDCAYMNCAPNEVYDPCPSPCPLRLCGFDDTTVLCPRPLIPGDPNCRPPTCRCKDGYYRNDAGQCVLREQCPICKGINEIYDPCPATCPAQRCDVDPALVQCLRGPSPGDPDCQPGCRCIDDHVRNQWGVCIPRDKCPQCPRPNEIFDPCIAPCPPHSCDVDERLIRCAAPPQLGDPSCKAGCRCDDGFFKTSYGDCVKWEECPPVCNDNEVYSDCINGGCSAKNCSQIGQDVPCVKMDPKYCIKGCLCKEGYLREQDGVCVPEEKCKRKCGPNEFYDCGNECDNECATLNQQNRTNCPLVNIRCNDKCYCVDGYARDENDICIPVEKCKVPKCGKHEVFSNCTQLECRPQNCSQLGFEVNCPEIDPKHCTKGCVCEQDYVQDYDGVCIPKQNCSSCGGDRNAVSGCGINCNRHCKDIGKEPVYCILVCPENKCDCKPGYYQDDNTRKCVLPKHCTPTCRDNEVYSNCIQGECRPQNCTQLGQRIPCPRIDPKYCKKGCLCKDGYLKNGEGLCVPVKECPPVCKDNEVYSDCINGGCSAKNCSQIGQDVPCVKMDPKYCIKGCLCKEGYLREKDGVCVPEEKCKRLHQCNKNEVYDECPTCQPRNCSDLGNPLPCDNSSNKCQKPRCVCKSDYVWNDAGVCIPKKSCSSCGGDPNAVSGCGNCVKQCEHLIKEPDACILICKENACDCQVGYYFDKPQKKCVLPSDCTGICGKNEVYENCDNPSCRPKKCSEVGYELNCTDPIPCKKGCVCKIDHVRSDKGDCIPMNHCPSCRGDKNAVSGCGVNCLKKCYDLQFPDEPKKCPKICKINDCDCKVDYYLDEIAKKCVKSKDCTPICGPDEVVDSCINGGCDMRNCSQIGRPKVCIDPIKCKKGCACKNGFLRSGKGICIPMEQCPRAQCPKHEKFEKCPEAVCRPLHCDELGYPIDCISTADNYLCSPGCICVNGYVKDKHEKCIPKRDCPSCGGDPNAWSGCEGNCNRTCEDLNCKPKKCSEKNYDNSCDCKDDFYFDGNTGKCVTADCCTPTCRDNQVYDFCVNGGCGHRNCSQLGRPILCIDPITCKGGCTCKDGYLQLDETGECIPQDTCPNICNKPHEEYVKCPPSCPPQTCESVQSGVKYHCPLQKTDKSNCVGECRCKKGYYRNLNDDCVSKEECLKCTGDHEYFSCGSACDNVCRDLDKQSKKDCPIKNIKCVPQCYCEDGYARDSDKKCVPICDCPDS